MSRFESPALSRRLPAFDSAAWEWQWPAPQYQVLETTMAKPELGQKRACVSCTTRFYDLTRAPAICPKCGTEQPAEQPRLRRGSGNVAEDKRPKKVAVAADDVEVDAEVAEEADEDVLDEAADDEDADAIPDEIEVDAETDERG